MRQAARARAGRGAPGDGGGEQLITATEQYWLAATACLLVGIAGCLLARRLPRARPFVGRTIAIVLAADAVMFVARAALSDGWTVRSSLPLDLCDIALGIAAITCWFPGWQTGVELTWFWGMAGTLQAVVTPDLSATFPQPDFVQFVVGHVGIVTAALYLVVGAGRAPSRDAVPRVFAITVGYTALVGVVDAATGANYMFLRHAPAHASLLDVLGPWPWYVASAAGVALVLFVVLALPFRSRTCSPARER